MFTFNICFHWSPNLDYLWLFYTVPLPSTCACMCVSVCVCVCVWSPNWDLLTLWFCRTKKTLTKLFPRRTVMLTAPLDILPFNVSSILNQIYVHVKPLCQPPAFTARFYSNGCRLSNPAYALTPTIHIFRRTREDPVVALYRSALLNLSLWLLTVPVARWIITRQL